MLAGFLWEQLPFDPALLINNWIGLLELELIFPLYLNDTSVEIVLDISEKVFSLFSKRFVAKS